MKEGERMTIVRDFTYWKAHTPSQSGLAVLMNPNFHLLMQFRFAHFLYKHHLSPLSKLVWIFYRCVYAADIDFRADIGEHFMIIHGVGIVIGKGVKIGKNCTIYQNCTIGGNGKKRVDNDGNAYYMPVIEDNVKIYTSSVVLGPVKIGENSIIGATSFVDRDIKENTIFLTKKEAYLKEIIGME